MNRYAIIKNNAKTHPTALPEEERKEKYPQINVGHTKGELFFVAFCYLPHGSKMIIGDYSKIVKYVETNYTACCHAMIKPYTKKWSSRNKNDDNLNTRFIVLGRDRNKYKLLRGTKKYISKVWFSDRQVDLEMPTDNHRYWILTNNFKNSYPGYPQHLQEPKVLGYWRKLPKVHLRQF